MSAAVFLYRSMIIGCAVGMAARLAAIAVAMIRKG